MATYAEAQLTNEPVRQRRFTLWHASIVVLLLAMVFAGYLSVVKLTGGQMVCVENSTIFDCGRVENSRWAWFMGIPTAVVGFIWYSLILTVLITEKFIPFMRKSGVVVAFGMALFAFTYHCYLTFTAITVIGALCPWCLAAHTSMTIFLILTTIRLVRHVRAGNLTADAA